MVVLVAGGFTKLVLALTAPVDGAATDGLDDAGFKETADALALVGTAPEGGLIMGAGIAATGVRGEDA